MTQPDTTKAIEEVLRFEFMRNTMSGSGRVDVENFTNQATQKIQTLIEEAIKDFAKKIYNLDVEGDDWRPFVSYTINKEDTNNG